MNGRRVTWSIGQRSEGDGLKSRQRDLGYIIKNFLLEGALTCWNVPVAEFFFFFLKAISWMDDGVVCLQ